MSEQAYSDTPISGAQQPLKGIVTPHENDVLSGRGNFVNYHSGNEHFRSLVKKHKIAYVACPKPEKGKFSRLIVDEIRGMNPPGRFLKQDPTTKMWYDIGDKKALDKTRQALREGAPELIRELHGEPDEDTQRQYVQQDPYAAMHAGAQAVPQMQHLMAKQDILYHEQQPSEPELKQNPTLSSRRTIPTAAQDQSQHQPGQQFMGTSAAAGTPRNSVVDANQYQQGVQSQAQAQAQAHLQLAAVAQRLAAAQGLPPSAAASIINQIPLEALEPTPINPYLAAAPEQHVRPSAAADMAPPPAQGILAEGARSLSRAAGVGAGALAGARMGMGGSIGDAYAQRPGASGISAGAAAAAMPGVKVGAGVGTVGEGLARRPDAAGSDGALRQSLGQKIALSSVSENEAPANEAKASEEQLQKRSERRDSLTLEDVKKASINLRSMKNMAMSSAQMSFDVGDLDSNLSAAFEDSLVISPNTGEVLKKDGKSKEDAKAAQPLPSKTAASAVAKGRGDGQEAPDAAMLKQMAQSNANMSFSLSDAVDMLGGSTMGMSYRFDEEEK